MKIVPQSVEYVAHMGSDLSVVNAARVSFHKTSSLEDGKLTDKDIKLINYLAKHNHWTPFGHTSISLRIKAPIFVARQLGKHQVGFVWNEVSRRYVDEEPEFFFPTEWRGKPVNAKQGSSGLVEWPDMWSKSAAEHVKNCLAFYQQAIDAGIAPEQARMILPQNMMTEWIWTGSVAAFSRVCKLRLDAHTQQETQEVAKMINGFCTSLFPVSFGALQNV